MNSLDTLLEQYKRRVAILTELRTLVNSDPQLAGKIVAALGGQAAPAKAARGRTHSKKRAPTQFDRALALMRDKRWRTMAEISEAIGAQRTSLAPNIYRDQERFERRKDPKDPRQVQWRLKDESNENHEVKDDEKKG